MLHNLNTEAAAQCAQERLAYPTESRWNRSEEEDMQQAIAYLYEFKKKLDKLHPNCMNLIQNILQGRV